MARMLAAAVWLVLGLSAHTAAGVVASPSVELPLHLRDTGLYAAGSATGPAAGIVSFAPQYPLWSDGADKQRWLYLPPGSFIDAANPDAWEFPRGTKLWKQFSLGTRRVETRLIERRADGSWQFATYVWNDAGDDAVLAPAGGIAALPVPGAPGGHYAVPARADCMACHGGAPVPVLGASALQLSPERDPLAAHRRPTNPGDVDLRGLVARDWLRHLPPALLDRPPRIAAASPQERAALGYLHGNCGHCHNSGASRVPVRLTLAQSVVDPAASRAEVLRSAVDAPSRYLPPGMADDARVLVPGSPHASVLGVRMNARHPQVRMPPLGTELPDPEGLALISRWITNDLPNPKEATP